MKKTMIAGFMAFSAILLFACLKSTYAASLGYTVQDGDSLSSIAESELGDPSKWVDIFNANRNTIANPNIIYSGEVLQIPEKADNEPQPAQLGVDVVLPVGVITQSVTTVEVPQKPVKTYSAPTPTNNYPSGMAAYQSIVVSAANKYGISASLMDSIIECESGFNPNSYNPYSGATGIAQFMPGTYYGSWNIYKDQYPISSPIGQIYAMALKISEGGVRAWSCYKG